MDDTDEYLEMCKEAHKFIGEHIPIYGDRFVIFTISNKKVWIPYQDQLQSLLIADGVHDYPKYFISCIHEFAFPEEYCIHEPTCKKWTELGTARRKYFNTMEQWTLAFIMDDIHNKQWDGSEWV